MLKFIEKFVQKNLFALDIGTNSLHKESKRAGSKYHHMYLGFKKLYNFFLFYI